MNFHCAGIFQSKPHQAHLIPWSICYVWQLNHRRFLLYLTEVIFIWIDSFFIRIIEQRCESSISFILAMAHFFFFTVLWKYNSLPIQFTHLKWIIQWFLVYSQHCATIATISFQNISITSKRNPIPTKKQPVPFPCPPAEWSTSFPTVWICLFYTFSRYSFCRCTSPCVVLGFFFPSFSSSTFSFLVQIQSSRIRCYRTKIYEEDSGSCQFFVNNKFDCVILTSCLY